MTALSESSAYGIPLWFELCKDLSLCVVANDASVGERPNV